MPFAGGDAQPAALPGGGPEHSRGRRAARHRRSEPGRASGAPQHHGRARRPLHQSAQPAAPDARDRILLPGRSARRDRDRGHGDPQHLAGLHPGAPLQQSRRRPAPHGAEQGHGATARRRDRAARRGAPPRRPDRSAGAGRHRALVGRRHDPGRLRLISAKDLFVNQSSLTGEAMPVEKTAAAHAGTAETPFDLPNICFMGTRS